MRDYFDSVVAYSTATVAYLASIGWSEWWHILMSAGSAVLLVSRMYVDISRVVERYRRNHGEHACKGE